RLTPDLAVALKEAGVGQVQISLNGATEETNATTRPNFGGAMAAIHTCRQAGLRFGINFLITRSSVAELEQVIRLGRRLGAATVNLLRPKPPTTDGDWLERESLDAEGYRVVRRVLRKLQSTAKDRVKTSEVSTWHSASSTTASANASDHVGERGDLPGLSPECKTTLDASLTFLLTDRPPERLYAAGVWGCCAARKFVTVLQDGRVLPCSHVRWSDVGQGDFTRAWRGSKVFQRFRQLEGEMRGRCRACSYLELCKGCPAVVMAFGGSFAESDPHCPKRDVYGGLSKCPPRPHNLLT
ncbi:MAG: SPASM domain-containing protein, partial [Anaerolineae bacterium]